MIGPPDERPEPPVAPVGYGKRTMAFGYALDDLTRRQLYAVIERLVAERPVIYGESMVSGGRDD